MTSVSLIVEAAVTVYEDWDTCREWAARNGFERFESFDHNSSQGMLVGNDEVAILAFRGTQPTCIDDIRTDIRAWKSRGGLGRVHSGFKESVSNIIGGVINNLWAFVKKKQRLIVTGHSMGGGMAEIACCELNRLGYQIEKLVTIGQPRVGNFEHAFSFDATFGTSRHMRFVNNNDVVARTPWKVWNYHHTGTLHYFDSCGQQHINPDRWLMFVERLVGRIRHFGKFGTAGLADHSRHQYLTLVKRAESCTQ